MITTIIGRPRLCVNVVSPSGSKIEDASVSMLGTLAPVSLCELLSSGSTYSCQNLTWRSCASRRACASNKSFVCCKWSSRIRVHRCSESRMAQGSVMEAQSKTTQRSKGAACSGNRISLEYAGSPSRTHTPSLTDSPGAISGRADPNWYA